MPWCPKCGREYREGFSFCVDCQCSLTDDPPETARALLRRGQDGAVLLCEIEDGPKTGLLTALLEGEGIPVLVRYPSIGPQTKLGADLPSPRPALCRCRGSGSGAGADGRSFRKQRGSPRLLRPFPSRPAQAENSAALHAAAHPADRGRLPSRLALEAGVCPLTSRCFPFLRPKEKEPGALGRNRSVSPLPY